MTSAPNPLPVRHLSVLPSQWALIHRNSSESIRIPVSVTSGRRVYQAVLMVRGGHTRSCPKKSYELRIKGGHTFHWNAEYEDPSMIRNALSFHFFNRIGVPAPKTRHFQLMVNGQPLGVYLEIEAVSTAFFASRGIQFRSILYAVNDHADFSLPSSRSSGPAHLSGYELVAGGTAAVRRLEQFIRSINLLSGPKLQRILLHKLDIRNYLGWLAGAVLTGNYDGFEQNYALYEEARSGKYRIIPWDYEGTWGRNCFGKPCGSRLVSIRGYNRLTRKVLSIPANRSAYRKLLRRLLRHPFNTSAINSVVDSMYRTITPAVRMDPTRPFSYQEYAKEPSFIRQYIRERRRIIQGELKRWV
ncbi:spore coat protein CotH [Paenibacillus sambharensis]|uniref:Spore coat protein CotH n=1 Tax=Paenibacillus sambharensis TaxID=1803190 RepID=A0A2W1LJA3_9BACL|nr:CotH kinase family protein [Paenibacillus sambharensis]PZD95092.1 spore coat protein CotH [Paenibacillus sambharensis]